MLGWFKKKLPPHQYRARYLALVSCGCLYISMCTRRVNGNQFFLLFSEIERISTIEGYNNILTIMIEQLAKLNEMTLAMPHYVMDQFLLGAELRYEDRKSILSICINYSLLDDDRDNTRKIMEYVGNFAHEMRMSYRDVEELLDEATSNILYRKVFEYQFEDSEERLMLEKAIGKTYCPLTNQ